MKTEEQSSTSVTKKIITPNNELLGLKKSEEQKEVTTETTKLPNAYGLENVSITF